MPDIQFASLRKYGLNEHLLVMGDPALTDI